MNQKFIFSATRCNITLLFSCFLATAINFNFGVRAYVPIAIGEDSSIPPNEIAGTPVWQTYPPTPSSHPGYEVTNVGNTAIWASIYWKDSWPLQTDDTYCEVRKNCSSNSNVNIWYQLADPLQIEPSKSAVIRPSAKGRYYFTKLVVIPIQTENSSTFEGIVNVEYEDGEASSAGKIKKKRDINGNSNSSVCDNVKIVFKLGGSKLPATMAVSGMEALIELFWPENKISAWDEVRDQVINLIDQETSATIKALLTGRLIAFKRKLEQLAREIREGQPNVSSHYMILAYDLIGLEEESVIRGHHNAKKLNEDLLPVYSNIILMKAALYSFGMKCYERFGLSQQDVANLRSYFTDMIRSPSHGANQHVSQIFRNRSPTNFTYDKEMTMRNKIKEHGYVPIWNNMLDHPGQKLVIDKIFYSNFLGGYDGKDVLPPPNDPLTSSGFTKGKYNELQELVLYQSSNACPERCCVDTIVGMKLIFKNGDMSVFGRKTYTYRAIELNDTYRIRKIEARNYGDFGVIAHLHISLLVSDKNEWRNSKEHELTVGCPSNGTNIFSFAKENYYIGSIYTFFDNPPRRYSSHCPFQHMAVSYLPVNGHSDDIIDEKDWKTWSC